MSLEWCPPYLPGGSYWELGWPGGYVAQVKRIEDGHFVAWYGYFNDQDLIDSAEGSFDTLEDAKKYCEVLACLDGEEIMRKLEIVKRGSVCVVRKENGRYQRWDDEGKHLFGLLDFPTPSEAAAIGSRLRKATSKGKRRRPYR